LCNVAREVRNEVGQQLRRAMGGLKVTRRPFSKFPRSGVSLKRTINRGASPASACGESFDARKDPLMIG
jgi:hypothetical protein